MLLKYLRQAKKSIGKTFKIISYLVAAIFFLHLAGAGFLFWYGSKFLPADADQDQDRGSIISQSMQLALLKRTDNVSGNLINQIEGRRLAVLTDDWVYCDRRNAKVFRVIQKYEVDFASIPWYGRLFLRPFGTYSEAAVLHDWLYAVGEPGKRLEADLYFYEAMRQEGTHPWVRRFMFGAVRLGGGGSYGNHSEWYERFYDTYTDMRLPAVCVPPRPVSAGYDLAALRAFPELGWTDESIRGAFQTDFCPVSVVDSSPNDVRAVLSSDMLWAETLSRGACLNELTRRFTKRVTLTFTNEAQEEGSGGEFMWAYYTAQNRLAHKERCLSTLALNAFVHRAKMNSDRYSGLFPEGYVFTYEEASYEADRKGIHITFRFDDTPCDERSFASRIPPARKHDRIGYRLTDEVVHRRFFDTFNKIINEDVDEKTINKAFKDSFGTVLSATNALSEKNMESIYLYSDRFFESLLNYQGVNKESIRKFLDFYHERIRDEQAETNKFAESLSEEELEAGDLPQGTTSEASKRFALGARNLRLNRSESYPYFGGLQLVQSETLIALSLYDTYTGVTKGVLSAIEACDGEKRAELEKVAVLGVFLDWGKNATDINVESWLSQKLDQINEHHLEMLDSLKSFDNKQELEQYRLTLPLSARKSFDGALKYMEKCKSP